MKDLLAFVASVFFLAGASSLAPDPEGEDRVTVTEEFFHIGNTDKPDWKGLAPVKPDHPTRLRLPIEAGENKRPLILEIQAGGVGDAWRVEINGRKVGELKKGESASTNYFELPPGRLREKDNELKVECENSKTEDDIFVGKAYLHRRSLREILRFADVQVVVRSATGEALSCRLTLTRLVAPLPGSNSKDGPKEELAELTVEESKRAAVRRGIFYTLDGRGEFSLPSGRYRLYATRGFEYSLATADLDLAPDERKKVELTLEREVDTTGYLAADTHIHTKTYSGHGDSTVEERLVTIAGEGVEVAIATDHNHHTDYRPAAKKIGAADHFLPVVGNEFTTSIGHFNAFPIDSASKPAKHGSKDWVKLLQGLRATPGVKVVILNHPRRPSFDEGPFGFIGFNPVSGEAHRGVESLSLDAVEVVNGQTLLDDPTLTIQDWFGLLNRGHAIAAVAGSDSHTVEGIVGQSRTYVKCSSDDPRKVKVEAIADAFRAGRLLVSLGLLADVRVNGKFGVGDLATGLDGAVEAEIVVRGPRWTRADRVALYLDGEKAWEETIDHAPDAVVKLRKTVKLEKLSHDAHLVVVASGPPITAPYWPLKNKKTRVIGATNPVWLDGDGDGRYTSAGERALQLAKNGEAAQLEEALRGRDRAVAVQAASLLRGQIRERLQADYEKLQERAASEFDAILRGAGPDMQGSLQLYAKVAPPVDVRTVTQRIEKEKQEKKEKEKEAEEKKAEEEKKKKSEKKRKTL